LTLLHIYAPELSAYPSVESIKAIEKQRKTRQSYIDKLGSKLKAQGLNIETVFKEVSLGEEATEIIKLADEGNFSLVAMATHGRSGIGRWIFGSNAQKVLYEGSTPMLLVRPIKSRKKAS
jgi:nucleotide-binding universal stress UspA family protein